jgi:hypothetical protein
MFQNIKSLATKQHSAVCWELDLISEGTLDFCIWGQFNELSESGNYGGDSVSTIWHSHKIL